MILDVHSHVLPNVDDGSRDVNESIKMLEALYEQDVKQVIATPHFLANHDSVESFVERRRIAYERLMRAVSSQIPKIMLGAEVEYYPGICRLDGLDKLCIEGTRVILLEMPMSKWSKYVTDEIINMSATRGVRVVIAHFERCMGYQDRSTLEEIYSCDVMLQMNASFLLNLSTRRKALTLLNKKQVHFIGSDCHNMTARRPRIGEAYDVIERKIGVGAIENLTKICNSVFNLDTM